MAHPPRRRLTTATLCTAALATLTTITTLAQCGGNRGRRGNTSMTDDRKSPKLTSLKAHQQLHGFTTSAVYLDDAGARMGGRFVHVTTGFVLDLVFIESAPQAFIWVNTFPTSDKGEPHTQEHLLLGKGNKGRYVASVESMSLGESSAFTMQWRTCYHFHTVAGVDVFWSLFDHRIDGLLHPDYSDEEIRREVRNFGVAKDAKSGELRLEEKGTVYNEMVSSFESPNRRLWREIGKLQYSENHPLALSSGGLPAAIRTMSTDDIRRFHAENYHLGNMGMIAAFPRSESLTSILSKMDATLEKQSRGATGGKRATEADLPAPKSAPPATDRIVDYPHSNAQKPGLLLLAWPPMKTRLSVTDELLLELFLDNVAGDSTTNLYKKLIDSESRTLDLGASGVWSYLSSDQGHPIYIGASNVRADELTTAGIAKLRDVVIAELRGIAAMADGSPELAAFNKRIHSRISETRRGLSKFMNSPPRFGFRGTSSGWMNHLHQLARVDAFEKSLTMKPQIAAVEALLNAAENPWRSRLDSWGLTRVSPYGGAARANPQLLNEEREERNQRIKAETNRLATLYGTATTQQTLTRFSADYDRATAQLETTAAGATLPEFIDAPPMTLDDTLVYEQVELDGGVAMVRSKFESMTGATVAAAFDLHGVAEDDMFYLSALAALMTRVGVVEGDTVLSHEQVTERLRNEVLSTSVYLTANMHTGRAELVVRGAGNDPAESVRALVWMQRFLLTPNWRPENLARIRDVVDQIAKGIRTRMSGAEETWVNDPAAIYAHQDDPILAHTSSFLTRSHDIHRLRWMLRRAASPGVLTFLDQLESLSSLSRDALKKLTQTPADAKTWPASSAKVHAAYAALDGDAKGQADNALSDLRQLLADIPDDSLPSDWRYLCAQIRADLATAPAEALAGLERVRGTIARRAGVRMFAIGSPKAHEATKEEIAALLASTDDAPVTAVTYSKAKFIDARLRGRDARATSPIFVGLVNPNTQGGVFINSAPSADYASATDNEESMLRYLAGNLYSGHGAHSMFMKTWSAGLAYSNGLRVSVSQGRVRYYAERCPELTQTLRFVIGELEKGAGADERKPARANALANYAIAQAFNSRVAASFEGRGDAMAADLADGTTPARVRAFRAAVLELRKTHKSSLGGDLLDRMADVYGAVLPGYGPGSSTVEGGVYFVIGPESQLESYEQYLRSTESKEATLFRIYPRDFWVTRKSNRAPDSVKADANEAGEAHK